MRRVMVTGAAGQLGSTMVAKLSPRHTVAAFTRSQLDLGDDRAILQALRSHRCDVIVNCAAYNDVDATEDDPSAAITANALVVQALARASAAANAMLIHYGTDFVFDGSTSRPYLESDAPRPLSAYGMSKLLGEWLALASPRGYVLRVESLFGGRPAKSSLDKIAASIRDGQTVRVFADRTITPTFVDDIAMATERLIATRPEPGIYHCVNEGPTTWLTIAQEIGRLLGVTPQLVPITLAEVKLKARRPLYCALSNDKLRAAGIEMPPWQDALARYLA